MAEAKDSTRESYDRVSGEYASRLADELDHKPFDRERLDELATRWSGAGPVVDLGCGPGQIAGYLHARGVDASGIDLSPGMIERARALFPTIEFRVGDMRALDLDDESLAGITAFYSIIHIPRDEVPGVLGELHRVLEPKGLLFLAFHLGNKVEHLDEWFDLPVSVDFCFYEREEMEAWVRDAGFEIEAARERDPYPDVEAQTRRAYLLARRS
jgi:SAM-dependent methyltransferase